jgi:hypothetical protein
MRAIDEPVLDLTQDEAGRVPEPILDLTGDVPEATPDVIEHAADLVLDLTEDGPHLALPDLPDTPIEAVDGDTRAFLFRVYDRLTSDEQASLVREAAAGDRLAEVVTAELAKRLEGVVVLGCSCSGIAWHPEPDRAGERRASCGAWSPVSLGVEGIPF